MSATDGSTDGGRRPGLWAWTLLAPLLLWLLAFVVLPTAIMVVFSFSTRDDLGEVVFQFTPENYTRLAEGAQAGPLLWSIAVAVVVSGGYVLARRGRRRGWLAVLLCVFWTAVNVAVLRHAGDADEGAKWLKISVISINYAAASTAIRIVLGYPVAFFIGQAPERWRNLLLLAVSIPFWTSFLVRTYAWVTILRENGAINWLLMSLKIIDAPIGGLYPSQTGVMIGLVYTYLPFMILPIYTSVEKLDRSLIEASFDLGATPMRAFWRVVLPLTTPGIVAGIVLVFVPAIGMFAVNDILGGRQEMLIGNVIERQFTAARDKPFGSAMGMILLAIFIATYALGQRRRDAAEAV